MELNEYQKQAMTTCMASSANECYMLFGLTEEVGELCGKVSKAIRKETANVWDNNIFAEDDEPELFDAIKAEAGDVLWMLAGLCHQFGWSLEEVAQYNLSKLAKRKASNTITTHKDH